MTHYPEILLRKSSGKYDWYEVVEDCLWNDVVIPKGFNTDFASVPQVFWAIIPPHGKAAVASVVHDYLYQHQSRHSYTRAQTDNIWIDLMKQSGVPTLQRYTMYSYVRALGWINWKKFQK